MELFEYLFRYNISLIELAEKSGVHRDTISRVMKKKKPCHKSTAEKISKATNGIVSVDELLNIDKDIKKI